jgi:hypothetical protein
MSEPDLDRTVTLELSLAEAVVLDQWLRQMEDPSYPPDLPPVEQAQLRLRWNLVALLEKVYFPGEFGNSDVDFDELVEAATGQLRDERWRESE